MTELLIGILRLVLLGELILISVTDIRKRLILNKDLLFTVGILLVLSLCQGGNPDWVQGIVQFLACLGLGSAISLFSTKFCAKCCLGMGDVKLIALFVLFLSAREFLAFLVLASLLSCVWALFYAVRKERAFPLAPVLCVSFFFAYFDAFVFLS